MPQGDKSSYTDKQQRKAAHIEESYRERGVSAKEAGERAWRTVNKQDGGAKRKSRATSSRSTGTSRKHTGSRKRGASRKRA